MLKALGKTRQENSNTCHAAFWLFIICWILVLLWGISSIGHAAERVTVCHIVQAGETLADIGKFYANPDIKDPRYVLEFTAGIREANEAIWNREPRAGDRLLVTFWAVVDYD